MSVTDIGGDKLTLPAGVTVGTARETSQAGPTGTIESGLSVPFTTPGGTTTTVFVPYSDIEDASAVQQLVTARLQSVMRITG